MAIITLNNNSLSSVTSLPAGVGGKVLQVVTATDSTERTTTSTSFVTASNTLAVNITPSATSSKIFVTASFGYVTPASTSTLYITLNRDSTNLGDSTHGFASVFDGSSYQYAHTTLQILDSPSTTSQITYQPYIKVASGTGRLNNSGALSTITAYEISG